ncbi:hypothetical protein Aduo_003231 [Ancylostoma duodenale]
MSNRSESAGSGTAKTSKRTQAGAGPSAQTPVVPNRELTTKSALAKVDMIPSKTVTFFPNEKRQQTYVVLSNSSDRKVMFKMKSTRPGVYKMKPVFGVVNPGEKYSIRVTYMGIKVGHRIPLNDRITVVLAAVTSKAGEEDKEATESEMKKRKLYILYKGVNDQVDPEAGGDAEKKRSADKEQAAKSAADQKAYMEGYDEGYKAAIIDSRDPKASDNPAEALERLQKSKGIGKEPIFQEGFTEGYKKAMALLKTTDKKEVEEEKKEVKEEKREVKEEKKEVKEEKKEVKEEKKEVKEEKSEPKEVKPPPKEPQKEPAKGTAKESGKLTPKEDRAKVRGRKSKSKSKQSKKGSKAKDKKVAKTPKKKSKVVTTEVVKPAPKEAAKEPVKPPPKAPPEQVKTPKKVKSPPKEPVKEAPKKPEKEPPKELAKPPPSKELARSPEPKKVPQMVKEEVKEVKVKREEAKEVKKEFEKVEKEKKLSDGTNVTAFTPGGTDPSLGDPLKRQDIVHIGPTGKVMFFLAVFQGISNDMRKFQKQIVIIMYRDVALPEKLLSRSGDEDEEDDDVKSDMPQPPQPK